LINLSITYYPLRLLEAPEIHTDLLWDLGLLFGGLGFLYFLLIFWLRNRNTRRERSNLEKKRELAPMISNFLFFEQENDTELRETYIRMKLEIREMLKTPKNRRVLTEVLMDLRLDVSGDARDRLFRLYQDLGLDQDAYQMLNSWRWERVSRGIRQLTEMRVTQAYGFIRKFINDRRGVIRKQAELATVTLRKEGMAYFLDTTRYGISEWQQLKLLEILQHREDYQPPRFGDWLVSENKHVVLFSLRLIRHFRQNEAEAAILQLLRHRDQSVKVAAIECIREFHFESARAPLKALFKKSGEAVKLSILNTLETIGNPGDCDFLQQQAQSDTNFIVRSKARSVLNRLVPDSVLPQANLEAPVEEMVAPTPQPETTSRADELEVRDEQVVGDEDGNFYELEVAGAEEITIDVEETHEEEITDEDLALFDICLLQELDAILNEYISESPAENPVPEFLPMVTESAPPAPRDIQPFRNLPVTAEILEEAPEEPAPGNRDDFRQPAFELDGEPDAAPDNLEYFQAAPREGDPGDTFSIVREFYNHCDAESKLILLAAIPEVGEEKELAYLNSLADDPEPEVRKAVREAIRQLTEKLGDASPRTGRKADCDHQPPAATEAEEPGETGAKPTRYGGQFIDFTPDFEAIRPQKPGPDNRVATKPTADRPGINPTDE